MMERASEKQEQKVEVPPPQVQPKGITQQIHKQLGL
jgi:hypothetical protein